MERNRLKRKLLIAAAAAAAFIGGFLSTAPAGAQTPAPNPDRFDLKVREDFFAGVGGDSARLAKGMKACEEILATNPKAAEALVWHGAGTFFLSGQAFQGGDQQKGIELWTRGINEMKTGVELSPDNPGTRIPRGATLLTGTRFAPPEMAKPLMKDALEDYEHIYEIQKPYFATLGTHPRGELLFGLAEGYSRFGNNEKAQFYFEQIKQQLPNSAYAKRADLWLTTKSLPMNQTGCIGCHVSK
jgi:hypothetical protein